MERSFKGSSIIKFSEDYIVIDIETTGLSTEFDEIIEISAIKYKNHTECERFSSLVKPPAYYGEIPEFIERLTGITNAMLINAPELSVVIPSLKQFIENDLLVGHNVSFDINFLYDAFISILGEPLSNNYVDTLRISRKLFPELKHHRLTDMIEKLNINTETQHRAVADCETTNKCYISLSKIANERFLDINEFYNSFKKRKNKLDARTLSAQTDDFDISHPLYGKVCVFTGTLDKMQRKDAMQAVLNCGGEVGNGVTKKTNYLILGCNDYCKSIKDGKSSKQKKAEEYKLNGYDIEIIDEDVFYSMLEE